MQHRLGEQRGGKASTTRSAEAGARPAETRKPPPFPLSASGGNSARGPGPAGTAGGGASPDYAAKRAKLAEAADARMRAGNRMRAIDDAIDLTGAAGTLGISDGAGGMGFFGATGTEVPHQPSAGVGQRAIRAERGEAVVRSGSGSTRAEIATSVESMRLRGRAPPPGYSLDGKHEPPSGAGPASVPTSRIDARAAGLAMEDLLDILQREDGEVEQTHRAAAEKAMFNKIGDMDNTERSERDRAADDVAIRTLDALRHRLNHGGLKMLVSAYMTRVSRHPRHPGGVFVSGDFARDAAATIPDESRSFRSAQEAERVKATGLADADAGITTGVAEMENDAALDLEGNVFILSVTTPSEAVSWESEEFRTPDENPTPDQRPLLEPD